MKLRLIAMGLTAFAALPAEAEWWEARTDNFVVYSESSARDAREFAERLQRFENALRSLQNLEFRPEASDATRLTVFRSGKIDDVGRIYGSQGVAGFYIPQIEPVAFTPARRDFGEKGARNADRRTELDPQTVLFHEYSHHFMYRHFSAAYPAWYREGFAEAYSTIELHDDGSFHLGNAPQSRGSAFSGGINYSIQRMLQSTNRPGFEETYGRYTYGWLLTHYLTFEPSRAGQLQTYLKAINEGIDPSAAAESAFGNHRQLESDVNRYLEGKLPGALVRPPDRPLSVAMRQLSEDEAAIMEVKMRVEAAYTHENSRDIADDARSVAAKYPASFPVLLTLAEAELDAQNPSAAEAAVDRALAIKPQSVEARLVKAQTYLQRGESDPKWNATARTWLAKAQDSDPDHPAILYMNYLSYAQERRAIPESAVIGLEQAYQTAPYDKDVRLTLVQQLLAEKDGKLARSLLAPLVHSPHESKGAKDLREVYDMLETGKIVDASRALAAELAKQEEEKRTGKWRD